MHKYLLIFLMPLCLFGQIVQNEVEFLETMEGLKSNQPLRQLTYEKYSGKFVLDDRTSAKLFSILHDMYGDESAPDNKTKIIRWIGDFFNQRQYATAHEQLYEFAYEFQLSGNPHRDEETMKTHPAGDLAILVAAAIDRFSQYATLSPDESQTEDRIDFCVINEIPVPGVIPTMEEAEVIFKGRDLDKQLRTAQMLSLMGDRPKKLEATLVEVLNRKSLEDREQLSELQVQLIVVLGNLKTSNSKAIDYMISTLPHYGNDTEASEVALVKIGRPAVRPLVSKLEKTTELDGGLQYQLITMLGKIGKDAADGKKAIQKVLTTSRNSDVKYAAEAALQAIGGGS